MKTLLFIFFFCLVISDVKAESFASIMGADSVYLILDEPYNDSLPRNFRKSNGEFKREYKEMPDTAGLSGLNISGSAEFSNKSLPLIINEANKKEVTVIDLRQETHGFINGMPVSIYGKYDWANVGKSRDEIFAQEKNMLDSLKKAKDITIVRALKKDKTTSEFKEVQQIPVEVKTAQTEEQLAKSFNADYFRITATDHRRPVDEDVDRFISFITSLKDGRWIHFHCHAGDGRTTTFMTMYDMMHNAKQVSFEDIITRQYLLGGIDLVKDDDFPDYDKQYAVERTEFLKKFYQYCKTNDDGFKTSYTSWLSK